ncbi:recombinase family protein [Fastidiosibacter lacustris]|uniref:recombinase family protein n=1 Tax=Fastidiosibacter lacustris TaxID=2056695 RepID=UPI001956F6BC|nr:recombinase family protein [Fastidiosibacter lacustris]
MIYGYARVSTQDQNLDMQIESLNKYHCDEIITEKKSGTSLERPAFKKLLDTLRKDDTLIVYKLDRISRSTKHMITLSDHFKSKQIKFVSIKDQIDTATPMGEFFFTVTTALGQLERDILSMRVKDGIEAAKNRGVKCGRQPGMTLENKRKCAYAYDIITKLKKNDKTSVAQILKDQGIARNTYYRYVNGYKQKSPETQGELF